MIGNGQVTATAGQAQPYHCLTTDWVLGQFSRNRGKAIQEYRKYVSMGIGQKGIWNEVRGQALLGEDDFIERLSVHLRTRQDITEIPRSQRYASRPRLEVLFPEGFGRDKSIMRKRLSEAVEKHGYRQSEIARRLGVHYSTISRWLREDADVRRKT